jgi:hypothetical protein
LEASHSTKHFEPAVISLQSAGVLPQAIFIPTCVGEPGHFVSSQDVQPLQLYLKMLVASAFSHVLLFAHLHEFPAVFIEAMSASVSWQLAAQEALDGDAQKVPDAVFSHLA